MHATWKAAALTALFGALAGATTVYNVNLSIGATGHVTGFIETDGTTGTLGAANFVDWDLTISDGVNPPDTLLGPLSGNNSNLTLHLSDQSATASAILFNFSAADNGYFFFESTVPGNTDFVCFGPGGAGAFQATCAVGVASNVEGISLNNAEQNTALTGVQEIAAPEPLQIILTGGGLGLLGLLRFFRVRRA